MKYFVFENFSLRILSVLVAVIGWFYVNIIVNPQTERPFETDLLLTDRRSDCSYKNIPKKVNVFIRGGRRDIIENYYPVKSKLVATANVSKAVSDMPNKIPVNVVMPRGIELVSVEPRELDITPILIEENTVDVLVKPIGEPKPGYYVKSYELSHKKVRLRGPKKIISGIKNLVAQIKVDGLDAGFSAKQTLGLIEITANENNDISINPKEIDIAVSIAPLPSRSAKVVPVVSGKVAAGFSVDTVECEPKTIMVKGAAEKIEKINEIKTEMIDITGARQGLTQTAKLDIAEAADFTIDNKQVTVTITLKQTYKTQRFRDVAVNVPKMPANYEISLEKNALDVEVNAPVLKLVELGAAKFSLDVELPAAPLETGPVMLDLNIHDSTINVDIKPAQIRANIKLKPDVEPPR
ncbi:MAG TPA: CdaR family protein [Candidatus Wallbacteria bacterium]|nr:CdaR family protein [Candidatus Wallbacteria bacterium]